MLSRMLGKAAFQLFSRCFCTQTSVYATKYSVVPVCHLSGNTRERHGQLACSGHIFSLKEIVHMCVYLWERELHMCLCHSPYNYLQ